MNKFHKFFAVAILISTSFVSACTSTQQAQGVAAFEAAYTVDANVLADYKNGNLGIKPSEDVINKIKLYDNLAKERLDKIRLAARNNQTISVVEQIAATDAINALTSLLKTYGLIKDAVSLPEPK